MNYQLKRLCVPDCANTENMFINSIHISLYDISLTQNILYEIKRDVAVWNRLGWPQVVNSGNTIYGVRTNFSEIPIKIQIFSFMKMNFKMLAAKWCPFCSGMRVETWHNMKLVSLTYFKMRSAKWQLSSQWRNNGRDSVSNHQPHDCLLNRLFKCGSKKTSKLRVTGLCAVNSPGTGEFPA